MPAVQILKISQPKHSPLGTKPVNRGTPKFPSNAIERKQALSRSGKPVTAYSWKVYDALNKIPQGKVMTYASLCEMIGEGSARSLGTALRNNPWAPEVPCHRVVRSDLTLGGYLGDSVGKGANQLPEALQKKRDLLIKEGIVFESSQNIGGAKVKAQHLWEA